jgi:branched-chain amino acid transport system substrate-binding protein
MSSTLRRIAVAVAVASVATQVAADIKVGALYPYSGGLALLGQESFRGLELAAEEANAAGGLKKGKIVLVKGDAVDANQAVGEARRLVSVEGVKAVFGTYSSSLSLAGTQVTELARVPFFELGAISDPITERGMKYVFRNNPTAKAFAYATVDAVTETFAPALGVDPKTLKIGIIHEDSLYGQTVSGFQKTRAAEKGLKVVEILPYPANSVDLSSVILRLKGSGVDVVLQTSYANDTVLFFRQAKEMGYRPKTAIGAGGGYALTDTAKAVGINNIEGALNVDFPQFRMNPVGAPGVDEFMKRYQAKYGTPPRSGHSLANYQGAKVFFQALDNAKSLDADAIRAAVLALDMPEGKTPTGWGVKFAENGQNTRALPVLLQWQGGELVTVAPKAAAVAKVKLGIGTN